MTNRNCLIITHTEDYTTDLLVNYLNQQNLPYFRLNTDNFDFSNINISYEAGNLLINGINMKNVYSIWYRRIKPPIALFEDQYTHYYFNQEFRVFLNNLFSILDVRWLSNPFNIEKAENKLLQLKTAQKLGLNIPPSLITCNLTDIENFIDKHGETIIKPLYDNSFSNQSGSYHIYTNVITKQHISKFKKEEKVFAPLPSIIQKRINKKLDIRVTIIGEKVFAAAVNPNLHNTQILDWRNKGLRFTNYKLPKELSKKLVEMVADLGLAFGAIDIVLSDTNDHYFLEINPNGQWGWLELENDLPISEAISHFLYN